MPISATVVEATILDQNGNLFYDNELHSDTDGSVEGKISVDILEILKTHLNVVGFKLVGLDVMNFFKLMLVDAIPAMGKDWDVPSDVWLSNALKDRRFCDPYAELIPQGLRSEITPENLWRYMGIEVPQDIQRDTKGTARLVFEMSKQLKV